METVIHLLKSQFASRAKITLAPQRRRLLLSVLLVLTLAMTFWLGSRYPQLNEKAQMGGSTQTMGISFDFVDVILLQDSYVSKITSNTINWIETNKKGMIFGLLFAAGLILVFNESKDSVSNNRWKNAGIGMIIGAPLGVCVNCATPIAQGIKKSGGKSETALAVLMSSPTFNFIVLGMLFALLPLHLVLIKLVLSFLFISVGIPLIIKLFPVKEDANVRNQLIDTEAKSLKPLGVGLSFSLDYSWLGSVKWVVKNYFKALWYICIRTLPFMLLAGILGNVLVTFFPLEQILEAFNLDLDNYLKIFIALFVLALICTFLPVPMAFDVIITVILLAGGLPMKFAGVVLFSLGIFSIYPFLIISKIISYRVAIALFLSICSLGVVAGTAAHFIDSKLWVDKVNEVILTFDNTQPALVTSREAPFNVDQATLKGISPEKASHLLDTMGLAIHATKYQAKTSELDHTYFEKINGPDLGLKLPYEYSIHSLLETRAHQRSNAVGDINKDGWSDLILSSNKSIFIFANNEGQSFVPYHKIQLDSLEFDGVASVDLDNDGWLDLFMTTYKKGAYYLLSNRGQFETAGLRKIELPTDPHVSMSYSFADLDSNGELDVFIGNWALGIPSTGKHDFSDNYLILNVAGGNPDVRSLSGTKGETLSSLFSDFDMDGDLDLLVGNDFEVPDIFYQGSMPFSGFDEIKATDSIIPLVTNNTMSLITGDINNDLIPEIYSIQFGGTIEKENQVENELSICNDITDEGMREDCRNYVERHLKYLKSFRKRDFSYCPDEDQQGCQLTVFLNYLKTLELGESPFSEEQVMNLIGSEEYSNFKELAHRYLNEGETISEETLREMIPQQPFGAVMLSKESLDAPYKDITRAVKIPYTGWSWNTKFADLNNDEYQDIYISNGFHITELSAFSSNIYYENQQGLEFQDLTQKSNLDDLLPTQAYSYLDFDNDGDLDIVTNPQIGPMMIYLNQIGTHNHSISFELTDTGGNHQAIGTKVYITYGPEKEKRQYREILASGGFKSLDSPIVHFGLGEHKFISSIEIHWTDGTKTILDQEFESGFKYTIARTTPGKGGDS